MYVYRLLERLVPVRLPPQNIAGIGTIQLSNRYLLVFTFETSIMNRRIRWSMPDAKQRSEPRTQGKDQQPSRKCFHNKSPTTKIETDDHRCTAIQHGSYHTQCIVKPLIFVIMDFPQNESMKRTTINAEFCFLSRWFYFLSRSLHWTNSHHMTH
jgi:hypothetical protein